MKLYHLAHSTVLVALCSFSLVGCGGGSGGSTQPPPAETISVTCVDHIQIGVSAPNSYVCKATENGDTIAATFSVSDTSLATINPSTGILTPNSSATGTLTVTATFGSATPGTTTVKVVDWILYQNAGSVMVMNSDGSGQTMLLPQSAGCWYPTWSYGHLGFICGTDPTVTRSTFLMYSTDGTAAGTKGPGTLDLVAIGGLDSASFPRFSPDGKSIIFTGFKQTVVGSTTEDIEGVWTIGADGTGLIERATEPYGDGVLIENPRFSPDGKEILYQKGQYVWLMDADGGNPHQLVNTISSMAMFSPDMTKLYYISGWGGISNITSTLANADGSNPTQISSTGISVWDVSLRGNIVLWDMNTDAGQIIVASPDGSNQKTIAVGGAPSW